jgi:L-lactate dehydrogenase complex protein LldG
MSVAGKSSADRRRRKMTGSPGNKEQMLAQIRVALGRDTSPTVPLPLPPVSSRAVTIAHETLIGQFSSELEKVGGCITRVSSIDGIREPLLRLLAPDAALTVAASDGHIIRALGIREWLVELNVSVVPTLREFTAPGRQDSEAQPSPGPRNRREGETLEQYKRVLSEAKVGVTSADYALADTGTLVLISGGEQHRLISLLPPIHVCLLNSDRILASTTDLLARVHEEFYSRGLSPQAMTCITGPSRTADIEQTITMGVHGPQALHVILYPPQG